MKAPPTFITTLVNTACGVSPPFCVAVCARSTAVSTPPSIRLLFTKLFAADCPALLISEVVPPLKAPPIAPHINASDASSAILAGVLPCIAPLTTVIPVLAPAPTAAPISTGAAAPPVATTTAVTATVAATPIATFFQSTF